MSRFTYISSFDELSWTDGWPDSHIVRCDISWDSRPEVLEWVNNCSTGVRCWNGTSGVGGSDNESLGHLLPSDKRCYLIFSNEKDMEMFLLKYSTRFNTKYFGNNYVKAWNDSRK